MIRKIEKYYRITEKDKIMKIGIVFHKEPVNTLNSIDNIRLKEITQGLQLLGFDVEIVAGVKGRELIFNDIPVVPLDYLAEEGRYRVIKTCYHTSIDLISKYSGKVISRIVRVVDNKKPERDGANRKRLLYLQELISRRSCALVFNNKENIERWQALYGRHSRCYIVQNGCPRKIPLNLINPYCKNAKIVLFLGSICALRIGKILNQLAVTLPDDIEIHLIGKNKLNIYAPESGFTLSDKIVNHNQMNESDIWNYIYHADIGLVIATGPYSFDNDFCKVYSYLRGGLPVLSEQNVVNNDQILKCNYGQIFSFDQIDDLRKRLFSMLKKPFFKKNRSDVMAYMSRDHSWYERCKRYKEIMNEVISSVKG